MHCEVEGKVYTVLPETTGQGKNGEWKKREFVIETPGEFPKKVAFTAWNERIVDVESLGLGQFIKVVFRPESRENAGKWYSEFRMSRIEVPGKTGGSTPTPPVNNGGGESYQPPVDTKVADTNQTETSSTEKAEDDLPF